MLGARTLLGAPGLTTSNKKLLVAPRYLVSGICKSPPSLLAMIFADNCRRKVRKALQLGAVWTNSKIARLPNRLELLHWNRGFIQEDFAPGMTEAVCARYPDVEITSWCCEEVC